MVQGGDSLSLDASRQGGPAALGGGRACGVRSGVVGLGLLQAGEVMHRVLVLVGMDLVDGLRLAVCGSTER